MRNVALALALGLALPGVSAAQSAPTATPISIGSSYKLNSVILKQEREINVRLPAGYADPKNTRTYPVIYLIDGGVDQDFPHVAGLMQHGEISWTFDDFILVGIKTGKRIWELTPPTKDERYTTVFRKNGEAVEFASGGGADTFRRYIAEEVEPFVKANFRASGHRTLLGESLAAFFIVDTMVNRPTLADDFIAVSPSMWWNREELANGAEAALAGKDYRGKRLYVTMANEGGTMQRGLDTFLTALRGGAAGPLQWIYVDRRSSEHHGSIYHGATLDALRSLYPKPYRPGSPLPWLVTGDMVPLSKEAEADKKVECTTARGRKASFADFAADPAKWEAMCSLPELGRGSAPVERSANWSGRGIEP